MTLTLANPSPNPSPDHFYHFQTLCPTLLKGQRFVEIDEERDR